MADIVNPGQPAGGPLNAGAMPANYDLSIYKGDAVDFFVLVKNSAGTPVDLTGHTPKASLKSDYSDATQDEFTCTVTGVTGQVRVYMSPAATAALVPGSYIWDFQITPASGDTRTYLAGDVTVYNEVTT